MSGLFLINGRWNINFNCSLLHLLRNGKICALILINLLRFYRSISIFVPPLFKYYITLFRIVSLLYISQILFHLLPASIFGINTMQRKHRVNRRITTVFIEETGNTRCETKYIQAYYSREEAQRTENINDAIDIYVNSKSVTWFVTSLSLSLSSPRNKSSST